MARIARTQASRRDAADIWHFIALDNERAADKLLAKIHRAFELLSETAGMGRLRPEFGVGVRSTSIGNYIIFYRPIDDGIEVLRIFHAARDIRSIDEL